MKKPEDLDFVKTQHRTDEKKSDMLASGIEIEIPIDNLENEKNWHQCRVIQIVKDHDIFK
jgi:hypothetical protein